jgi:luciferase-like monooxygenase
MAETVQERVVREVSAWPGVTVAPHQFGGIEFRVGRRELGHLHGSRLADLPFPRRIRDDLVAAHEAEPHHVLPASGWVSYRIRGAEDVAHVVALFRLNYERPWAGEPRERSHAGRRRPAGTIRAARAPRPRLDAKPRKARRTFSRRGSGPALIHSVRPPWIRERLNDLVPREVIDHGDARIRAALERGKGVPAAQRRPLMPPQSRPHPARSD